MKERSKRLNYTIISGEKMQNELLLDRYAVLLHRLHTSGADPEDIESVEKSYKKQLRKSNFFGLKNIFKKTQKGIDK